MGPSAVWSKTKLRGSALIRNVLDLCGVPGFIDECDFVSDQIPVAFHVRRTPYGVGITCNGIYFSFDALTGKRRGFGVSTCGAFTDTQVCGFEATPQPSLSANPLSHKPDIDTD
jgi:hypothetical protein